MGVLVHLKSFLLSMETSLQLHQYAAFLFFYAHLNFVQHNLPALHDEGDIEALLNQEASDYLVGYQVHVPHLVADCRRQIRLEIGCTTGV